MRTTKKLKEKDRDLWYEKLSERTPVKPQDESFCSSFDWVGYMMDEYRNKSDILE